MRRGRARTGRLSLLPLLALSLAACAGTGAHAAAGVDGPPAEKYVSPDRAWSVAGDAATVTYRGLLAAEGVARVVDWLDRNPQVRRLAIESQGGDTVAAMRLGDELLARGLDVEVVGSLCASSCANYVFVSGRRKSIAPGARVVWHGSPLRPEGIPVVAEAVAADGSVTREVYEGERLAAYLRQPGIVEGVERERQRNLDFFAARGVDGRVTVYGQEAGCGCNWTFGVDDMRRFGIEGVVAEEGYPVPLPGPGALPVVTLRLDGASGLPAPRED